MTRTQRAYIDCLSVLSIATLVALGGVGVALGLGLLTAETVAELYPRFLWFLVTWTLFGILMTLNDALNDLAKGIR